MRLVQIRLAFLAFLVVAPFTIPVRADSTTDEIAHLLTVLRESPCTFIRNGSDYDGAAAVEHVEAKYLHFKREIKTAEDFIDRAATKSLLTGTPYQVRCDGAPTIGAAEWLHAQLQSYRAQHVPGDSP